MSHVVVVGAGVGGLAAAARLAAWGHQVTVVEQADQVGGKLGWWERDGAGFDTGPSLLTLPHVFEELFEATGGWPDSLSIRRLDPICRYRFADGATVDSHDDLDEFAAALDDSLGPGSGAAWRALAAHAHRLWDATHGAFLESELRGFRSLAGLALRRPGDLAVVRPWRTLRQLGQHYLPDPRLRMLLERYATYAGSDPRRAPAALATIAFAEQRFGGWYVEGGLHRLGLALAARAVDRGAVIRTGADVAHVLTAGGRTTGVRLTDGEVLAAPVVVVNADATHLYRDLLVASPSTRRAVGGALSYSGLALLLGVRGPRPPGLAHHQVVFPADYTAEFDDLRAGRAVDDPAIYLAAPDDPSRATGGIAPWFVLVNAPREGQVDWDVTGPDYAARVLGMLEARGVPVRDRLAFCEVRTPADLGRATRAPGGAIYGTSSDGPRAAFLRPRNRSPVRGVFLVGGSAHPGGGLPLVALSARIVAGLIGPA